MAAFTPQGAAADIQVLPLAVSLTSSSTPSQCQSPVLGDPEAPVITGVQHAIHPANSLIFDFGVDLNSPARLWVEYWPADGAGGVVRTALTDQSDTHHDLQVMRLYFDTEYCYQVYATTGSSPETESTGGALVSESVPGWFTTGSVPPTLADAQFVRTFGGQSYDLTLMEYNATGFTGALAIDRDGVIVWYYEHPTRVGAIAQKGNYNLLFNVFDGVFMEEIRPDGTSVAKISDALSDGTICSPEGRWHHEMQIQPGNKVYTLGSEIRTVDFPASPGARTLRQIVYWDMEGQPQVMTVTSSAGLRNQTGDTIVIWDQDAATTSQAFSLFDVLNPLTDRTDASDSTASFKWEGCDGAITSEDWTHSNALWVAEDGNVLMSIRHLNQIIAIKPDFTGLAWRLGGPGGDFTFPDPSDQFYHQHSTKMLPGGNVLLFDNGNGRPAAEGGSYSRALELELDLTNMTAKKVWEYRHSPDLFAGCCSNVTRLENGNTVLVFGAQNAVNVCCRKFTVVESDANGNAVSVIENAHPGKGIQYRVYPIGSINGEAAVIPSLKIVDRPSGLATTTVDFASTIVMKVVAEGAVDVSGLQFQMGFDPSVVRVASAGVVPSPDIQGYSFGYDVNNEAGFVAIATASSTRFGRVNVEVADIEFQAVGLSGRCTDLTFPQHEGSDNSVPTRTIDVRAFGGSICLTNAAEIPALSSHALVLMVVLMALGADWHIRRRPARARSGQREALDISQSFIAEHNRAT